MIPSDVWYNSVSWGWANVVADMPPARLRRRSTRLRRGAAHRTITAGPGVAKLLAGRTLAVLKDTLENALAGGGVNPQGATGRVAIWAHACERAATDPVCQQGIVVLAVNAVTWTGFDASGVATFTNVPNSGAFYLFADTGYVNQLLWSVRIDLKPGANAVTFDERNNTALR
jgi:hypothetical protein